MSVPYYDFRICRHVLEPELAVRVYRPELLCHPVDVRYPFILHIEEFRNGFVEVLLAYPEVHELLPSSYVKHAGGAQLIQNICSLRIPRAVEHNEILPLMPHETGHY